VEIPTGPLFPFFSRGSGSKILPGPNEDAAMPQPATNDTDWAKWGAIAAIAAVAATLLAIYVSHYDQQQKVNVVLSPLKWQIGDTDDPDGKFGTVYYDMTVYGKAPARNVYIAERCVSPVPPMGQTVDLSSRDKTLLSLALLPGTLHRRCTVYDRPRSADSVKYLAEISYDDDAGHHSVSYCFFSEGAMFVDAVGPDFKSTKRHSGLTPCNPT
jgi:hypothetical protein